MPKLCAIAQSVSALLNPIPVVEHFRLSHHNVSTVTEHPSEGLWRLSSLNYKTKTDTQSWSLPFVTLS